MDIFLKPGLLVLILTTSSVSADPQTQPESTFTEAAAQVEQTLEQSEESAFEQRLVWAKQFWQSLKPLKGRIDLKGGVASLDVPETFYFLGPEDSERVLTEAWQNPPGSSVLGMLFPDSVTPFDADAWAVTVSYDADGYVSDEDADEIDYDALLVQMKDDAVEESRVRQEQGFESIEIVGWASKPYYDKGSHKLHWAKEIRFGTLDSNTLNYNIRALGRKGVLVFNFVADIGQQAEVEKSLDTVLAMSSFNPGYRYDEFDPAIDEVAAYGLGALVAGKAAAKLGLLATLLLLLKKFWFVLLLIPVAVAKLFGGKKKAEEEP